MKNPLKKSIDKALDRFLPKVSEEPRTIHKAMRYSVFSGGKRIRPIILIESARLLGARPKDAMAAACAVECIHTYSLVHDDLPSMDDDDYRRGKPACHVVFGEAIAILAGDALLTLAFDIMAKNLKPDKAAAAIKELAESAGTLGMVGGQVMDIESTDRNIAAKAADDIDRLKTARLFASSAKIGAIVAGSRPAGARAVARYGEYLGMAFQVSDDLIDGERYKEPFEVEAARRKLKALIENSKNTLAPFGKKAERLKNIADHVLTRTH